MLNFSKKYNSLTASATNVENFNSKIEFFCKFMNRGNMNDSKIQIYQKFIVCQILFHFIIFNLQFLKVPKPKPETERQIQYLQ